MQPNEPAANPPMGRPLKAWFLDKIFGSGRKGGAHDLSFATRAGMLLFLLGGLAIIGVAPKVDAWAGALWALACTGAGALLGFLFGIPARLKKRTPAGEADAAKEAGNGTGLEQIADWLTKVILGGTLTQLGSVKSWLDEASRHVAHSLQQAAAPQGAGWHHSFATALILYFSIYGFLCGYLITRVELSEKLEPGVYDET